MRTPVGPLLKLSVFTAVTALLTALLALTVASSEVGRTTGYGAEFTDASGIGAGDEVRMAGVRVGQRGAHVRERGVAQQREQPGLGLRRFGVRGQRTSSRVYR